MTDNEVKMRRIALIAAVLPLVIGTAPAVFADPAPPAPAPAPVSGVADGPTLSLSDLGAGSSLTFYVNHDVTTTTVTFPVPSGLAPVALKANVELPVNLRFGNLSVTQSGRTITRMPLPSADQTEMVIPLAGVQVSGNWVTLTLTVTAVPLEGYCWDADAPIRLANAAITFAGAEVPPRTVADFLPPVLRKVTIAMPAAPSPAESNAVVQLAAAVADRNGQKPEVAVVPLPDGATTLPAPSVPFERQIVVKEGPDKGLSLRGGPGVPALLISGPGDELTDQARLLAADSLRYAVSPTSVADTLPESPFEPDNTTLEQLSGSGLTSEALWPKVGVEIDQTRWGRPIGGVTVHLIGSYTPLPDNFGGEVIASVGNEVLARWPAEAAGTIDRTVTIPDRFLKRFTSVEVEVRTTGNPGHCGDHLPILLRLDGSTGIQVNSANPPMPQGFQSLPQALMPTIRVGIGRDAFGDTVRAAQIVMGLRRDSGVPLATEVTTLQQAMDSTDPAILISADGWDNSKIALPFSTDQGRLTVTGVDAQGQSVTLNLEPAQAFGSLQTVFDGQRTVLIATSTGAPRQLDELLRYLGGPGRWSGLNGRAIISAPGSAPVTVPNPPSAYSAQSGQSNGSRGETWFWWAVGGVAAVAAAGVLAILLRARRA